MRFPSAINNDTNRDDLNDFKRYFPNEQLKKKSMVPRNPSWCLTSLANHHLFSRGNYELSGNNTVKTVNDN